MISIKKYMNKADAESMEAIERMAQLLLQAIGLHAVEGERADYESFQATITDVQASITQDPSPSNVMLSTGSTVKALQDYNRRTSLFIRAQSTELQSIVGMLTQSMLQIMAGSQASVSRLQELQKQIENACMADDMRAIKSKLSECLEGIKVETVKQREDATRMVAELNKGLVKAQGVKPIAPVGETDPLTGIPMRPQAEAAIRAACAAGTHAYAGLFILDRLQAISSRFGFGLGDQVMLFYLQHLSQGLSPRDQLFRWGPETLLAVLHREEAPDHVRRTLARFLSRRLDNTFEVGDRPVVVPIASTWTIVPLFSATAMDVMSKLEAFASASGN
jgi:GGDEF domain-containing protein